MKFLPKDLSEKLVDMGCVSDSEFFYIADDPDPRHSILHISEHTSDIQAFSFEDFAGTTPQARENARLVFGERREQIKWSQFSPYDYECIDTYTPEQFEEIKKQKELVQDLDDTGNDVKFLEYDSNGTKEATYYATYKYQGWQSDRRTMLDSNDWIEFIRPYIEKAYEEQKEK